MKLFPAQSRQPRGGFSFLFHLTYVSLATAADSCSPWTWENSAARTAAPEATAEPTVTFVPSGPHVLKSGPAVTGDIVCRYPGRTYADVNYYTCTELADKYGISLEKFFMLNPELDPDCGNIKPYTIYCVSGFIEPLRAYDGKCGPPNNNATCAGTDAQCCNSETWTCGDSTTASAAVPANGVIVATWTANAVRGRTFVGGGSVSPEIAPYQTVYFRLPHEGSSLGTQPTSTSVWEVLFGVAYHDDCAHNDYFSGQWHCDPRVIPAQHGQATATNFI
ncbi:hypothetical protein EKO27_g10654 [Xylaria grammica]|uniref:LysM domain-containing protein n=1 Tax=Xylaria grammica TaxID=363999 RepID=A0A439CQP3_9PEZI|nr:hypothetical protein EKO27_g10654 [Xylaria grammica]